MCTHNKYVGILNNAQLFKRNLAVFLLNLLCVDENGGKEGEKHVRDARSALCTGKKTRRMVCIRGKYNLCVPYNETM